MILDTYCKDNNEFNNLKKKRGRKPKISTGDIIEKIPKKRGRKPTGKILEINKNYDDDESFNECMIAHLKMDNKEMNKVLSVKSNLNTEFNNILDNELDYTKNKNNNNESNNNYDNINNLVKIVHDDNSNKGIKNKHSNYINELYTKRKIIKSKINFLDNKNTWSDSTDTACWWCCHKFNNVPIGLPEYILNDIFYVFGCFCSLNCAYSYNLDLNDYKIWDRLCLLNNLKSIIFTDNEFILKPAPPKQSLKLFGGYMDIETYRNNFYIVSKDIIFYLPPLFSITGYIEENNINYISQNTPTKNNIIKNK